jgi:hypothetical protein
VTAVAVAAVGLTVTTAASIATQSRSADEAAAVTTDHVMRARILTTSPGIEVTVVVRELHDDDVVQEKREDATLESRWNTVSMLVSSEYTDPDFEVRLLTDGLAPGEGVTLSRVRWSTRDSGGEDPNEPTSPPTEDPDPTEPPTEDPDPSEPPTEEPDPTVPPTEDPEPEPDPVDGKLSNGCAYSARGIPACGAYLGQTFGSNSDPSGFEDDMGRRLGIRRTFWTGDKVDSAVRTARTDLAEGRLPWISFKLPYSWAEMASGKGDAWARDLAEQLDALDGPVWVAFHHEPETDGPMGDWTRMQERLGPIMRNTADNVAFTVIVTGWHQFYGEDQYSLENIWPQGMKVDVAGFDIYNRLGQDGNTKATDLDGSYFSKIEPWAKQEGLVWGLAETGFTDMAAENDPDWIRRTYEELEDRGGVAFAYFNTTLNSAAPWDLGTEAKLDAWREAQVGTPLLPQGG